MGSGAFSLFTTNGIVWLKRRRSRVSAPRCLLAIMFCGQSKIKRFLRSSCFAVLRCLSVRQWGVGTIDNLRHPS